MQECSCHLTSVVLLLATRHRNTCNTLYARDKYGDDGYDLFVAVHVNVCDQQWSKPGASVECRAQDHMLYIQSKQKVLDK